MSHNMSRIVSQALHLTGSLSCKKEKQLQTTSAQGGHPSLLDYFMCHVFHVASLGTYAKTIPASESVSPQSGVSQGKILKTR